jgi:hypothetical protein
MCIPWNQRTFESLQIVQSYHKKDCHQSRCCFKEDSTWNWTEQSANQQQIPVLFDEKKAEVREQPDLQP